MDASKVLGGGPGCIGSDLGSAMVARKAFLEP